MNFSVRLLKVKTYRIIFNIFPKYAVLNRPVFIIGCGRSGTTILGRLLAQHPQLAYLNEPRYIWLHEPRTDIWSQQAQLHNGQLKLSAKDVTATASSKIQKEFALQVYLQGRKRLVEKLPVNSFRINFINQIFPDALFIHLIRNGVEVAYSIAEYAKKEPWFGEEDYKWHSLVDYAVKTGEQVLVHLCTDNLLRGMLEWYLSVESAKEGLKALPSERSLEIRYENLIKEPLSVCERIEDFIGIDQNSKMREFAATNIYRKSQLADMTSLNSAMYEIGGNLLVELGYL